MLRKGKEVRSRTDYILGTDRRLFGNVSVQDPRKNSDHYMVLGCLPSASLTEHKRCLGGRKRWLMRPPTKPTQIDKLCAALLRAVPKAQPRAARQNAWISEETWRLVDKRVSAHRDPRKGRVLKCRLRRAVKASLAADRKRRADEAGAEVEALVGADPPLVQEAGTASRYGTRLQSTALRHPIELRSSGSRWIGLRCTAVSHPRETISQW